ncbi:MAG TPA: methyltransferase domain-containing protein [Chthoniobacterales bacterium]|nr:methyltransferase domain-containing protein [Chthoniobacterales bacterium]
MADKNAQFAGSIPAAYDRYLGPLFFQPYADDLAARLHLAPRSSVLELACGTGIVTRVLRDRLPPGARLVATDLNEPMMQIAAAKFTGNDAIEWKEADATKLPFGDGSFDAVVCQFGFMFFPDKASSAREAFRVLKPGGVFLFNVWGSLEENSLGQIPHETIGRFFEKDPPAFYQVPFGYHDRDEIRHLLENAGFADIRVDVVDKASGITRAEDAATGLVQGTPMSAAIAERDASLLPAITAGVAGALTKHFGGSTFRAPMRAIVVEARRQQALAKG